MTVRELIEALQACPNQDAVVKACRAVMPAGLSAFVTPMTVDHAGYDQSVYLDDWVDSATATREV